MLAERRTGGRAVRRDAGRRVFRRKHVHAADQCLQGGDGLAGGAAACRRVQAAGHAVPDAASGNHGHHRGAAQRLSVAVVGGGGDARRFRRAGFAGSSGRSEEHTSELQSLMRISYAVFCLKKKKRKIPDILTLKNKTTIQTLLKNSDINTP